MKRCSSNTQRLVNFVSNNSLMIFWVLGNMIVFSCTFNKYKNEPQYYYLRQMLGNGLCISRSSGTMINISCALIMLPMCRNFTTLIRCLNRKVSLAFFRILTDRIKAVHISCAYTMIIAAGIHTLAHVVNAVNFSRHFSSEHPDLNLAKFSGQNPIISMLPTVPGVTGVLMIFILFIVVFTSKKSVRLKHYNIFWYSHHLIFIFIILLLLHPIGGILKEQVNLEFHAPEGCASHRTDSPPNDFYVDFSSCSTRPKFIAQKSQTWMWLIVPLTIYVVDFLLRRIVRNSEPVIVKAVSYLPGSVVRITLQRRPHLRLPTPGQFVLINCPSVSSFEWHAFSVSCVRICGYGSDFDVHIHVRGDWSRKFRDQLMKMQHINAHTLYLTSVNEYSHYRLYVDGPFGSPFEDVILGPISICIAGGIGVTPFASVLNALVAGDIKDFVKLKRLLLVWSCRNLRSFTWLADLLCALHFKLWDSNRPDLFEIQLYVTSRKDFNCLQNILGKNHGLLIPRLKIGRPNWHRLFHEWKTAYYGKQVNIFSSGPTSLNGQIKAFCAQSVNGTNGITFRYHHESF